MAAICQRAKPANINVATLYTVPANRQAAVIINVLAFAPCKVRIGIGNGSSVADTDWLEYDVTLGIGGVIERTGIVLPAGFKVFVRTDTANAIAAQVYGIEEAA